MNNKIIDLANPSTRSVESLLFPVTTAPAGGIVNGEFIESPHEKVIMGEDEDGKRFAIKTMGAKFNAFPYGDVFACMRDAMNEACPEAEIVRAGLLDHGGRFFATFQLPGDISPKGGDDETRSEITLRSALNGKWKNSLSFGAFRMICANGIVQYSLKEMLLGFKRTLNSDLRIPEIGGAIETAIQGGESYREDMSRLVDVPLATPQMRELVAGFFANSKGEISTRAKSTVEEIVGQAHRSPGVDGKTAYDLLNGFTHHFSHAHGESEKSAAQWFDSQNFGASAKHKAGFAQALLGGRDTLRAKGQKALAAA